ncbi:MAG TPA: hypothetical protein PKD54_07670, partial [Pirellulaceae bacterium]|nr:hypothetical protein [Pirellulaceae bacterium]
MILLVALCAWVGAAAPELCAQQLNTVDSDRVVLLTNGNVLLGRVETNGQTISVWTESGSRMVLPRHQVDAIFQSMDGAYRYRRERIANNSTDEHVKLFEWCVQHKLWDQAQSQIDILQFHSIGRGELWRLSEKLDLAKRAGSRVDTAAKPIASHEFDRAPQPDRDRPITESDSEVHPVSYEERQRSGPRLLPNSEMSELVARLEPHLVLHYERHIDPILVRNCATGGCHGAQDSTWAVLRVPPGAESTRMMKLQNLIRTLQHWGTGPVEQRPLLLACHTPHAGLSAPIMSRDSVDYRALEAWIVEMAERPLEANLTGIDLTSQDKPPALIAFPTREAVQRPRPDLPEPPGRGRPHAASITEAPSASKLEQDIN